MTDTLTHIEAVASGEPRKRTEVTATDRARLEGGWPTFSRVLRESNLRLERDQLTTLQINVGKLCNQACRHCHVEAGPRRIERMTPKTAIRVIELMDLPGAEAIDLIDITGGAPELNESFRYLVCEARGRGYRVIDRCNLTVLFEPGQQNLAEFLWSKSVDIVASMPCYSQENVDKQRGDGVFARSIEALQLLNSLGYGTSQTGPTLDLVYNPVGPFLPPDQSALEEDYKERLQEDFGICFDTLLTITNMPIKRFLYDLKRTGELEEYMSLLTNSFNIETVRGVMCRNLISLGWEGTIYDCDFNQMLDIPVPRRRRTIFDIESLEEFSAGAIATADHCFGCTAGAGSSCGGQLN